jgi:predicted N-acetyltransferase YhbS
MVDKSNPPTMIEAMPNDERVKVVEIGLLTERDWADLAAEEHEPFGPIGAGLEWRDKDRNLGVRAPDGRLIAVAGATIAMVDVEGAGSFEVVGLGGLIVTRSARGHGLMSKLVGPILEVAESLGPERAMIFCRPELVDLYKRLAFEEIEASVRVDQPGGRIEMPEPAMWRALREGAEWPVGRVDVQGLPF